MRKIVWSRRPDWSLYLWQSQFETTVAANEEALGLSPEAVAEILADGEEFRDSMVALQEARAAYEAALADKDQARAKCIATNRRYVAQIQADPNIDRNLFYSLDVPVRNNSGPRAAPQTPTDVVAIANVDGGVVVKFQRGQNSESTVFSVQERRGGSGPWITVFSSPRTRVKLTGYPAGQYVEFRVIATRNGQQSVPSFSATIYHAELLAA